MSARLNELAIAIADDAARSDVECFAAVVPHPGDDDRGTLYDLRFPQGADLHIALQDEARVANRAAEYIDLRGDALPYRMHRVSGAPHLVWFEEKADVV